MTSLDADPAVPLPAPGDRAAGDGTPEDPEHHQGHRDVTGGWLRAAVFGAMDGLVSNTALIAGVAGAGASDRAVVLTGLAGLLAGAFSMATGEYTSVQSANEMTLAEVAIEALELRRNPRAEQAELAAMYRARGLSDDLARQVAEAISRDPAQTLRVHAQEELGVDVDHLPDPWTAATSSLGAFALGALVPLVPFLLGATAALAAAFVLTAVALFAAGALVSRFTTRSAGYGGARQLLLGAVAAGVTYGVGAAIGVGAG